MNNNVTHTEIIGYCPVDSGTLMIVDPCYVLNDERVGSTEAGRWGGVTSEYLRTVDPTCEAPWHGPVKLDEYGTQDMGVVCGTLNGDGQYPVIAEFNSAGKVVRLIIDFDYEEEEEEEEDEWHEECARCGNDITNEPQEYTEDGYVCMDCADEEEDDDESH